MNSRTAEERNSTYLREIESHFRSYLVDEYPGRAERAWARDYGSIERYQASVADMRLAWRRLLAPPQLTATGECSVSMWLPEGKSWWLKLPLENGLTAQAGLTLPSGEISGLVIFQHGLGSTPERAFGFDDVYGVADSAGKRLVEAGFAVLTPLNLTQIGPRNRAQRLARLAGTTIEGLEFSRLQLILEQVETAFEIPVDRIGLWGGSWGGMATQMWTPLDERIQVAVTSGFFNHRRKKMVVQDTRQVTFEDTGEDHAFLPGHLTHFSDADLVSLICPRPLMVQIGKNDAIGWWPDIVEEYEQAREHWVQLGLEDRIALDLHEQGHVVRAEVGVDWIIKWINE